MFRLDPARLAYAACRTPRPAPPARRRWRRGTRGYPAGHPALDGGEPGRCTGPWASGEIPPYRHNPVAGTAFLESGPRGKPGVDIGPRPGDFWQSPQPNFPMTPESLAFLKTLLDTPGPSSFEIAPARAWRREAEPLADEVRADVAGNSYATLNPGGRPRVMLAGHIDEIGVMVTHIDDDGFVSFDTIGGWDPQVFVGQRVRLLGRGGPVTGVVGKKAIHIMDKDDRERVSKVESLWIDIGAADRAEAERQLRVGDPGVLATAVIEFPNGRLVSRSIDNRIGAFVVLEALRQLARDGKAAASVTAVATTREEIAATGGGARSSAASLEPDVAVVVDVTHATDYPGVDKRRHGDYRLGGGPVLSRGASVSEVVFELLAAAAEAEGIPYTIEAASRDTRTDAEAIYNAHRGVATALVSVPNRYMHSPNEMVALEDLDRTARLLAAFARRLNPNTDFVPR